MLNLLANKRAMTILEIIIVVMLVLVVMGAGITPYIIQQDLLAKQFARNRLQDDISIALAYITRDAFQASDITVTEGNQLVLKIPTTPVKNSPTKNVRYNLDGANGIERTIDSGSPFVIASDITTLNFTRVENNYLEISITGTKDGESISMSSGVALRPIRPTI